MTDVVIKTDSLTKSFREVTALSNCNISINRGEVIGLLGPNGAGKSTLLRLLLGFMQPTSGVATIEGLNVYQDRVAVHKLISYLPGDARMFRTMRGKNAVRFFCDVREDSSFEQAQSVADRLDLDWSKWVAFMSTGMRQKLALTIALASSAPILILDEPTSNLDPSVRGEVLNFVRQARDAGRTVIFSSHVLSEIEESCDRVIILRKGRLVHEQSIADLRQQHRIKATLFGELPAAPESLLNELRIENLEDNKIQIETPGDLSDVMRWLANAPLKNVHIQPVSLRAVYDRFHHNGTGDDS